MTNLLFVTTNDEKFLMARQVCAEHKLDIDQKRLEVDEIQGEDSVKIVRDKAAKAYVQAGRPVVVTDDTWSFSGLRGWPGPYMHAMNKWLTPKDFVHLTAPLTDRRVTFTQHLVYDDGKTQKLFSLHTAGTLLPESRGQSVHASHTVVSLDQDRGLSIAEVLAQDPASLSGRSAARVWHEFCQWYAVRSGA
jgi:inosine/xanthosine triphosphate pyrophosphatase family protein